MKAVRTTLEVSVVFVSGDLDLRERVAAYAKLSTAVSVSIHESFPPASILPQSNPFVFVLPVDALRASRSICAKHPEAALIAYGPLEYLAGAFLLGCDDFLRTPLDLTEFHHRCMKFLRAKCISYSEGVLKLDPGMIRCGERSAGLSSSEERLLRALVSRRGEPLSRTVLIAYLSAAEVPSGGSRSVDMLVSSLRRKLRSVMPERDNMIAAVRGVGYRFV